MSHRRRRRHHRRRVHGYFVWNARNGEPEENVCIEENKNTVSACAQGGLAE